jgi:hypothetical protein
LRSQKSFWGIRRAARLIDAISWRKVLQRR